ncbi:MAG: hypothetical protein ACK2U9_23095 [Anaerolineae bacterium]
MTEKPPIWHYGLMAERWAETIKETPELSFLEGVISEEYTLQGNMYFKNEVMLMLETAGFGEITVQGDYSTEEATSEHHELVFTAIK